MKRKKDDMSLDVFIESLYWARKCVLAGTQKEINLAGIGESTMHPKLNDYISITRKVLGNDIMIILASNGVSFTEEHAKCMAQHNVKLAISAHRPEKAGPAVELARKYGILWGVSSDPSIAAVDWAGQVDWHVSAPSSRCTWVEDGRAFITSEGDIEVCCFDGDGLSICGNVMTDKMEDIELNPYKLCDSCHLEQPVKAKVLEVG